MYVIINQPTGKKHTFVKVREAARFMNEVRGQDREPTSLEVAELCNIFARHKNKISISLKR